MVINLILRRIFSTRSLITALGKLESYTNLFTLGHCLKIVQALLWDRSSSALTIMVALKLFKPSALLKRGLDLPAAQR